MDIFSTVVLFCSFKEIFRALRLDTHPAKMLAVDVMEEMAWDDFLVRKGESAYG